MNWIEKGEITVFHEPAEGKVILYSPLARRQTAISRDRYEKVRVLDTTPDDLRELVDYVPFGERPHVSSPEDYTLLTVLPNNRCNFSCSYCYSSGCRNSAELDADKLRRCIDFFVDSKKTRPERRNLVVSFMGGGEPMLSWNIVKEGIEYCERITAGTTVRVSFRIITNGSLLSDSQIDFIREHNVGLSVSFEILEDIQNLQRKNFRLVQDNLLKVLAAGIDTQLNVTVTPHNVGRIVESYTEMRRLYPQIRHAMFEPVTAQEMFATPADMSLFYDEYIRGFMKILTIGKREGVEITSFPYLRTVFPLRRACPGEFCITAEGCVTGCYCVSTPEHPLFRDTKYGEVAADGMTFDMEKFGSLLACNVDSREECRDCSARWNCGGGCYHLFHTYERDYTDAVCDFTRRFVEEIIKHKVNNV